MTTAPAPYEIPSKTDLRSRSEVAVDQAGHELVSSPVAIDLPGASIKGRLRGDLQSLDEDGARYCYYIRTSAEDQLPQWLADFGQNVRRVAGVKLVVVYEEVSPELERSCQAAGAGLVILTEDNRFEVIVNFDDVTPEVLLEEQREAVSELRRDLDRKLDLRRTSLQKRISSVSEITRSMTEEMATNFMSNLETNLKRVDDWGYEMSKRLDVVYSDYSALALATIRSEIEAGVPDDSDHG